jgi:RNA-directed DNA polymerase
MIGKYLRAGAMIDGRLMETRLGVPQGGPLSPLLANVILDDLDKEFEKRGHRFVWYADDFMILVKSRRVGERVSASVQRFLECTLKLSVNRDKSKVAPTDHVAFLGFSFRGGSIRWSEKAFGEFKRRVKLFTGRSWFVSMDYRLRKLAEYIRGWMNYFGISQFYRPVPEIDHWLRRRIRMCYFKQWRKARTKMRELLRLGTSHDAALSVALSRKGPWRLSRTFATQTGMTNKWLLDQTLISVKEQWVKIHYPAKAR